jgi:hypothetical protein
MVYVIDMGGQRVTPSGGTIYIFTPAGKLIEALPGM